MTSPNELEGAVAEVEEAIKYTLADHDDWLIDNPDMPDHGPDDTSASVWALRTLLDALASIRNELDDALHDYGNAESEAKAAEAEVAELKEALASITRERDAAREENERLRLLILGGEDVPGVAASLPFEEVERCHRDNVNQLRAYADIARTDATKAEAERDAMREVGKPFFDLAKTVTTPTPGSPPWWQESQDWTVVFSFAGCSVALGDLRRAAALVNGEGA